MARIPWYIDASAIHQPATMRMLAYMALAGREGVLGQDHLKVTALSTPGAAIQVAPGAFGALNRAQGGEFEAYCDKLPSSYQVAVPATDATVGGRTDLVIARVLNPYVSESGSSIPIPASPAEGPYWDVQVVTNVAPNTNSIRSTNPNYSAITLARIVRPINTGVVQPGHIVDLRSLVDLSGERIIIIDNPPPSPPPISTALWTNSLHFPTVTAFSYNTTAWTDWPATAFFDVPIPSWAVECDIFGSFNPQYTDDVWGEARLMFGTTAGPAVMYDENVTAGQTVNGPQQLVIPMSGTYAIPTDQRGKVVRVKLQNRALAPGDHPGNLGTRNGVYLQLQLSFKRYPY